MMTADQSPLEEANWPFAPGEMARRIRDYDWPSTPLGPIQNWPEPLRVSIDLMLGCAFPATVQWGTDLILFYNDAYISLIGSKHPLALGKPIFQSFPEIRQTYEPLAKRVRAGERIVLQDMQYRYVRNDQPEDRWFDLSYSPVHASGGSVTGVLAIGLDTTAKVLAQRDKEATDLRLMRVLETDAVGVVFFDHHGTLIDANDVFLRMTGYSRQEIQQRVLTWRTMTPPEWVSAGEEALRRMADTGRIGPYEKEYILKDGSRRFLLFAGRDLGDGTIAEYCIDVTDRRNAEKALQSSEQRFRAFVEATSDMLYRMSPDWTEVRHLSGSDLFRDTPGTNWLDKFTVPEDRASIQQTIQDSVRTKGIFRLEHRMPRPDGGVGWIFSRAVPLLNNSGDILEWFGAATDITVRKNAEALLIRGEKLATLGRMAASIAHEINNPLEAVTNLLYLIRMSDHLAEEAKRSVDLAEAELKRIAHITRQSLGFYRETSAPTSTPISEVLHSAVDLLKGKIRSRAARIQCDLHGELLVTAVPGELRQIFSNLLANSLDAIDNGGSVVIRAHGVSSHHSDGERSVRVTFADNGKGIPPEIRTNIFDPFYTTKDSTGTGLGLWVTKQILDKHGGQIRMRTRSDGAQTGTVFTVVLPRDGQRHD